MEQPLLHSPVVMLSSLGRVEDARRQLDTPEGQREFSRYWDSGVRHHAVLDLDERRIAGPRDVSGVFALLKAFRLLQLEHTENDTFNTAYIFLGCSIARPQNNLLYDVLGAELSSTWPATLRRRST